MSDQPWYHLIARIRPHGPVDAAAFDPHQFAAALGAVVGGHDLDEVYLLPEPAVSTTDAAVQLWQRSEEERMKFAVVDGHLHLTEALLGQLLLDAGWERTA